MRQANGAHAELYTLDLSPYESLHVAYYTILRGKRVVLTAGHTHPEYDAIYLGFSRDGGARATESVDHYCAITLL